MCEGGLVPDVMHDLLEGALQYEMKLMLQEMICDDQFFTLDDFNTRLENLDLGYMEARDRPTPIAYKTLRRSGNSLKQAGKNTS